MHHLPTHNKKMLAQNIRRYKQLHFPGKGGGLRLAEETGVAPQTVSNWLNGSRTPTFEQLYRLSIAFNVSPLELCGIREERSPSRKNAAISLLLDLLREQKDAVEHDVDPRASIKILTRIKDIIHKGMEEMKNDGKMR